MGCALCSYARCAEAMIFIYMPTNTPNASVSCGKLTCCACRLLLYAYELLGSAADPYLTFLPPHSAAAAAAGGGVQGGAAHTFVDAVGLLSHLLALQRWDDARECA